MVRSNLPFAVIAAAALTACVNQTNFREAAESFIEDESQAVATQLGVTFEDAQCEEPANKELGTAFTCVSVGSDGATYTLVAEITGDRTFVVREGATPIPGTIPATTVAAVPSATTVPAGTVAPATASPTTPPSS